MWRSNVFKGSQEMVLSSVGELLRPRRKQDSMSPRIRKCKRQSTRAGNAQENDPVQLEYRIHGWELGIGSRRPCGKNRLR